MGGRELLGLTQVAGVGEHIGWHRRRGVGILGDRVVVHHDPIVDRSEAVEEGPRKVEGDQDVELILGGESHFSPVVATPATKYFWKKAKTMSMGRMESIVMASREP